MNKFIGYFLIAAANVVLADETMYDKDGNVFAMTNGWQAGYSYTYDVKIQSELIEIDATAGEWTVISNTNPIP